MERNNDRPRRFGNSNNGGNRSGGFNNRSGGFNDRPRQMHKATCSECGEECEVPFKPSQDKPVYCRECFNKHKPKRY